MNTEEVSFMRSLFVSALNLFTDSDSKRSTYAYKRCIGMYKARSPVGRYKQHPQDISLKTLTTRQGDNANKTRACQRWISQMFLIPRHQAIVTTLKGAVSPDM